MEALPMSSISENPAGDASARIGASDAFLAFIEERYHEWENEFGDDVHIRRKAAFDPKQ
jgi:hypothetical protein